LEAVRDAVEPRMRDPVGTDNYYALLSPAGERLSGNLPISSPIFGWIDLPIGKNVPNGENSGLIIHARGDRIAGGAYLAVGRAHDHDEEDPPTTT
jgi:hypothetical protein